MLKDMETDELGSAVRKAAQAEAVMHPQVAARIVQQLQDVRPPCSSGEPE